MLSLKYYIVQIFLWDLRVYVIVDAFKWLLNDMVHPVSEIGVVKFYSTKKYFDSDVFI